jgi:tRNA-splicing ligase RtcB
MSNFEVIDAGGGRIIKAWSKGVPFEAAAVEQLKNTSKLPFIHKYMAAMPDCHLGIGATIGTVLPTKGAVVPAAVGVDIGCGMLAARTGMCRDQFRGLEHEVRMAIEKDVPCGRTNNGGVGDRGAWGTVPGDVRLVWDVKFADEYDKLCEKHPGARSRNTYNQLGTLGTGNHFIELAEDEIGYVWIVLHSGSRGLGNKIGSYFTDVAKHLCKEWFIELPDQDLAYLPQSTPEFTDYKNAVQLAQKFAWENRVLMLDHIVSSLLPITGTFVIAEIVHCHHNYIAWERHFGENVIVTRKGAVRAEAGDLGIIPGSMGARTYIVRGLGNRDSFCTCSHGAGRSMGRREAERRFSLEDHTKATEGIECDKSIGTIDETPAAYKDIESVMAAQSDLVAPVHILKQFINVKGLSDGKR